MENAIRRLSPWSWVLAGTLLAAQAVGQTTRQAGPGALDVPLVAGQPYQQARERLLQAGWRLRPGAGPEDCQALLGDVRCARYPELGACSSTGAGFCRFQWTSPRGGRYAVITTGGSPEGEPGIVSHWFAEE
jgi:hypothetical protein